MKATLIAFSPLGRSLLTDKPHSFKKAQTIAFLKGNPRFLEPNLSLNIQITSKFREYALDNSMSAAQLSLSWLLNRNKNLIPIPGTRSSEHLKSMAKAAYTELNEIQMKEIDDILPLGWAHGDRYSEHQWMGPEKYC